MPPSRPVDDGRPRPHLLVVLPSAELYGSDRALLHALPELVARFRTTLVSPAPGPMLERARALGAGVEVLPDYALRRRHLRPAGLLPWLLRVARSVRRVRRLHRRAPVDVLYSNTLAAGLGTLLRTLLRVPHVVHVHECPTEPAWLPRALVAATRRTSDLVLCNSEHTRAWVLGHQPALAPVAVVVHNGIEIPPPPPPPGPSDRLRVSCVGRVHPKKGQWVLVEAARLARKEGRRWRIDLFGDNLPEHDGLRGEVEAAVARAGLDEDVRWHGFVDGVTELYGDADVAVVPSVVPEEFSLVCAEAAAMQLPVVVTGPGGASEVVLDGETGVVVPPGDAPALHAALARLEDDPDGRRAMGVRGRARTVERFSRPVYAAGVRDAVASVLRSGGGRRP